MATKPSHSRLDISKLNFVLQVLRHYKFPEAKWFEFGLNLGLLHPTLEAIESAHRGDPSRCLIECLNKWLTKADDNVTTVGPIIWKTLANALHGMNAKSISSDIRKTMADPVSEILQCFIGRLAQVALTEESVDLLHTEGLISKDALTEVKSCGCSLVGDPMLLILSAVAEGHSKLCTLTSILMKSKEAVSLASDIIMEYGKSFPSAVTVMPSCQQASSSTSSRSGELQDSSSETQVTTNTDATAQSVVEVIVHPDYEAEFDRMGDLRGTLIDDIAPLIKKSIPSLTHLKTYLGRCRRDLKPRLKVANRFHRVMEVIEDECSITNVALLEAIVNKYSIKDAGAMILAYQTQLDEFCENKLTMFCNRQLKRLSSSLLTCETIKFVLKWNPSEHSLSSIRALLWKTFKDNQVEVVVIKEGNSIIVTCYAPHYLMESLLVTARDNVDMLKEMGLISLTIGYYTVYDEHAIDEEAKSTMKKLEMVESERDDLLEENAKLKGTIDTLGREVDESNKSSIQSSESEKEESKKKMTKAIQMEIDCLRSSLQSETGHPEPPGWACPSCTFKNLPYRPGCEVCSSTRPDDYQPPPNYLPTDAEKKFINNNDLQELNNFLENEKLMQRQQAEKNYREYLKTDMVPVVLNEEEFECPVCFTGIDPGEGIRLRDCLHMVCMDCLNGTILHSEEAQVKCPCVDNNGECEEFISDREIHKVLNDEELESFFKRGLRIAEATGPNSFHCRTADCPGFCFYEDEVNEFKCQNCDKLNCILCKAQHEGMNCQQYQDDLKIKAANDEAEKMTQALLRKMIADGEAMHCPHCKIIITKKFGKDWIRCVMCKTEMCWATKGPRWGPKGRGDVSGGCKCGVNGARCHPNCRNCH